MNRAREIAAITRREPRLLTRSAREVQRALDDARAVVREDARGLLGCLLFFEYGAWAEIGAAWVRDDARGRGLFADMHHEILPRIRARSLRAVEFPGSPTVARALARLGATPIPLRALPAGVIARMVADRATPRALASYVRAARAGVHRTSLQPYVFDGATGTPKPGSLAGNG